MPADEAPESTPLPVGDHDGRDADDFTTQARYLAASELAGSSRSSSGPPARFAPYGAETGGARLGFDTLDFGMENHG